MMKVAQRFCQGCPRMSGFKLDERSGLWVCGNCGLPYEQYYMAMRARQPEGTAIKYAKGTPQDEVPTKPISRRGRARS